MSSTEKAGSHRQILRSSLVIGGASIISVLIGLLRMKVVAVILGPAGVGLVGILNNMMSVGASVSALGLGSSGTRQIAHVRSESDENQVHTVIFSLLILSFSLGAVGAAFFWFFSEPLGELVADGNAFYDYLPWLAAGIFFTVLAGSQKAILTGFRRIGDLAKITIFSSAIATLAGGISVYILGEAGVIILILATPIVSLFLSFFYVKKVIAPNRRRVKFSSIGKQSIPLIRFGAAFMVAGLSGTLGQLVVRGMVQGELGSAGLGYFQASWAISMTYIGFVLTAMGSDYYPRLTSVIADHEKAAKMVNEQAEVALLLAGPVLVAMMSLAPFILSLLYTEEFVVAANVLRWQILGDVLKVFSWPMGFVLLACGKGKVFMVKEFLVVTVFAVTTWILLPVMGLEATGVGFFMMYAFNLPFLFFFAKKLIGFTWSIDVARAAGVVLLAILMIFVLSYFSEYYARFFGVVASLLLSFMSVMRLLQLTHVSGPLGRLLQRVRR